MQAGSSVCSLADVPTTRALRPAPRPVGPSPAQPRASRDREGAGPFSTSGTIAIGAVIASSGDRVARRSRHPAITAAFIPSCGIASSGESGRGSRGPRGGSRPWRSRLMARPRAAMTASCRNRDIRRSRQRQRHCLRGRERRWWRAARVGCSGLARRQCCAALDASKRRSFRVCATIAHPPRIGTPTRAGADDHLGVADRAAPGRNAKAARYPPGAGRPTAKRPYASLNDTSTSSARTGASKSRTSTRSWPIASLFAGGAACSKASS